MEPAIVIALALFGAFLFLLAILGIVAYRLAARGREAPLGAAGGCLLACFLGGLALTGLIAFAVFAGLAFVGRELGNVEWNEIADRIERHTGHGGHEQAPWPEPATPDQPPEPPKPTEPPEPEEPGEPGRSDPAEPPKAPRTPEAEGAKALQKAFERGWAQHPDSDTREY